jgi:CHASE2 domain-containing sensor protein
MAQRLLLNLGQGDWQTGFPNVTAQLWHSQQSSTQVSGSLPPAPHLGTHYQHWRTLYAAIYHPQSNWRGKMRTFEFLPEPLAHISHEEFIALCTTLETDFNQWLTTATFAPVERRMRTHLSAADEIQVMLTAHTRAVLQFPWRLWHLFEDYPQSELSLSLPNYSRSLSRSQTPPSETVRILAVLGNDEGIDVETDRKILAHLPAAQVTLLAQPSLQALQHHLWEESWDILFFAGHSSSRGQGYLQVNPTEALTLEQLKYALQRAIHQGLQLAILNSCDGLGLAWNLADLLLPQAIVMREPVPDAVAHEFLKGFLASFSQGASLYTAVREAREKLHGLTDLGNCAVWLPVIVQNPAEVPPTWQTLIGQPATSPSAHPSPSLGTTRGFAISKDGWQAGGIALAITVAVLALRWLGLLQPAELWAYDTLLKLRPTESADPRLVIVGIDEQDIQAQPSTDRRGSLGEAALLQTLTILNSYAPRIIGLDLYRDFPATNPALQKALANPRVVGLCKSRDAIADVVGIPPPPELAPDQVGFSDFLEEKDGIVRRQLLTMTPDPVSPCQSSYGFASLIAIRYLMQDGIQPAFTDQGDLQLGKAVLPRLGQRTGGLQPIDNGGSQLLLNYRAMPSPQQIAVMVPLQQLLDGQVNPESLRDRIILIGVIAPSSSDYWATPYGSNIQTRVPGVFMQAQMISQLISAVQDDRPLIWVWPQWAEALGIALGAILGSLLAHRWKSANLAVACLLTVSTLTAGAWTIFLTGGWLPLVPTLMALSGSAILTRFVMLSSGKNGPDLYQN